MREGQEGQGSALDPPRGDPLEPIRLGGILVLERGARRALAKLRRVARPSPRPDTLQRNGFQGVSPWRVQGRALAFLAFLLLLSSCASRPEFAPRFSAPIGGGEPVLIPMEPGMNRSAELVGRVCRPDMPGPFPVAVINHGSPSRPEEAPLMQPAGCDSEPAQWFTDHGFMVVFALRRGFGGSTGPIVESSGNCSLPRYYRSGLDGARDIEAILTYALSRPDAVPTGAVVVGQSTGGWAGMAYNSVRNPKAAAFINMAGGRGGWGLGRPETNCRPDLLVEAVRRFGESSARPELWIYAANDTFFPPLLVRQMHQAYTRSGGKAQLVQPNSFGADGHGLFYAPGGSAVWGPLVERYLHERGVMPQ